ncbi:MAG TPA: hypothetical protein VM264_03465 [Acidimicrobiales bacterium]|nr:hypothetical protein [Acidimicrobiales bacterium]
MTAATHEWVSFEDPEEERTWVFDVTFLASRWSCVFGRGCQGVLTAAAPELAQGCCSYGAHFTGEEDVARVLAVVATLTDEQWQYARRGRRYGVVKREAGGEIVSRLADGACIMLNRPGFPGGPGCALHRAALEAGTPPHEAKPDVCWQLPLRREDADDGAGHVTSTVRQWDRRHWGGGGAQFAWWCTEAPEAFAGAEPVYRVLKAELVALVGPWAYAQVAGYLDERVAAGTPLPHPAVRRTEERAPS